MSETVLSVRGLTARYGKVPALHGIDLDVAAGSIVSVIGTNGAGKSTLLGALMGALPATGGSEGSIAYAGERIDRWDVVRRVRAGLALVPERRELFSTMTVEDNLQLGAFRRYRPGSRDWSSESERIYALFPRLKERRRQEAGTLSGGERQMLALGRALMGQPRLLMLDEPSLGLAPIVVREIFHTIVRLRATGVAILLVEQNARLALQISDRGYVLESGRVSITGSADELATNPRVVESYLGLGTSREPDADPKEQSGLAGASDPSSNASDKELSWP